MASRRERQATGGRQRAQGHQDRGARVPVQAALLVVPPLQVAYGRGDRGGRQPQPELPQEVPQEAQGGRGGRHRLQAVLQPEPRHRAPQRRRLRRVPRQVGGAPVRRGLVGERGRPQGAHLPHLHQPLPRARPRPRAGRRRPRRALGRAGARLLVGQAGDGRRGRVEGCAVQRRVVPGQGAADPQGHAASRARRADQRGGRRGRRGQPQPGARAAADAARAAGAAEAQQGVPSEEGADRRAEIFRWLVAGRRRRRP